MENPFSHNRAINLIGQVLDENEIMLKTGEISFASLEYRIFNRLFNNLCLTEHAMETVGMEGRYPEDIEKKTQDRLDSTAEVTKKLQEITDRLKKNVKGLEGIEFVDNTEAKKNCLGCQKEDRREWAEPEEHTCNG